MRIDVYDFDGTIYDGDSTVDFVFFCLRRHPGVIAGLPHLIAAAIMIKSKGLTQFKSVLFGEMAKRFDLEREAALFWQSEKTKAKLGKWFETRPRDCRSSSRPHRRSLSCNTPPSSWASKR